VPGISAHQFAAHLRIEPLPESGKVSRGLHSPLIRREQVYYKRGTVGPNAWRLSHPEKVLKTRRYPWGLVAAIVNLGLTPALQPNVHRSEFPQKLRIRLLLEKENEVLSRDF
jgi:hypothetical protein